MDISDFSVEQIQELKDQIAQREASEGVNQALTALFALKWGMATLKDMGLLTEALAEVKPQAFPREAAIARPAGLSETQISLVKDKVLSALKSI